MTRDDILAYLNNCRKSEEIDPLHKWIGTYNTRRIYLLRFFKWLYNPDIEQAKSPTPEHVIGNIPSFKRKETSIYKPTDLWTEEDDAARNAPPVPTIPVKPEILPPVIVVLVLFAANFSEGLIRNKTENATKNIPRIICKMLCGITPTRDAPKKLRNMLGRPKVIIILLSNPCLKKLILVLMQSPPPMTD
jgi:hypothetical protein